MRYETGRYVIEVDDVVLVVGDKETGATLRIDHNGIEIRTQDHESNHPDHDGPATDRRRGIC